MMAEEIAPIGLDDATARELAADAIAQGGCVDCRFERMKEWAPDIDWDAIRTELESA